MTRLPVAAARASAQTTRSPSIDGAAVSDEPSVNSATTSTTPSSTF